MESTERKTPQTVSIPTLVYMPATTAVMPRYLAKNNKNHTPIGALITTNLAVQALLRTGNAQQNRGR